MNNNATQVNSLFVGDNLNIMKRLESESIDLIYLDPRRFSVTGSMRLYAIVSTHLSSVPGLMKDV